MRLTFQEPSKGKGYGYTTEVQRAVSFTNPTKPRCADQHCFTTWPSRRSKNSICVCTDYILQRIVSTIGSGRIRGRRTLWSRLDSKEYFWVAVDNPSLLNSSTKNCARLDCHSVPWREYLRIRNTYWVLVAFESLKDSSCSKYLSAAWTSPQPQYVFT